MMSDVPQSMRVVRRVAPTLLVASVMLIGCIGPIEQDPVTGGCQPGDECSGVPVAVVGGHQFTSLASGRFHTCGLTASGEAWCWGSNGTGQLGAVSPNRSGIPIQVEGGVTFASLTAGEFHTCGLATDGAAYCWGSNLNGALGTTSVPDTCSGAPCSASPVRAAGTLTFTALDAGATHTCGIQPSGATQCWGANFFGEIGSSDFGSASAAPVQVPGNQSFTKVSSGYRATCATTGAGVLYCWGLGDDGQLGTPNVDACQAGLSAFRCSPSPLLAETQSLFNSISAGAGFACGITSNNLLFCWGINGQGQLGNSSFESASHPVQADIDGTWSSVAVGYFHACSLRASGAAFCWGLNNSGQLGDGSDFYANTFPNPVVGGNTYIQIVVGSNHTCAITAAGAAWCWGADFELQLGRG